MDSVPESEKPSRFELEKRIDEIQRSPRMWRKISANPRDHYEWDRSGRMWFRRFPAERATNRRQGNLRKLVYDAARAFAFNDIRTVDRFLESFLRLRPYKKCINEFLEILVTQEDLREALHRVLVTQWLDKPAELLWKKPPAWLHQDSKNAKGYLYRAVRNEAGRIARDRNLAEETPWGERTRWAKSLPLVVSTDDESVPESASKEENPAASVGLTNPEEVAELTEFQQKQLEAVYLREAQGLLPERQGQVFMLRAEGCSYEEIARRLGITIGAAKAHMWYARQNPDLRRIAQRYI